MADSESKIFNYSPAEVISVLSLVGVGYTFIYKFSYFYSLGVPWYLNNISPLSIIISSMLFISLSILGVIIGFFIGSVSIYLDDKYDSIKATMVLLAILVVSAILSIPTFSLFNLVIYFDFYLINLVLFMTLAGFMSTINFKLFFRIDLSQTNQSKVTVIGPIIVSFVSIALFYGNFEAQKAINNPTTSLNEIALDKDTNKWFLIDYMGDKVLVMKEGKEKIFKIVEYKEIKQFKTPNFESN